MVRLGPNRYGKAEVRVVTVVRGDFVGCKTDTDYIGQPNYDRWYNLRLIVRIDRPAGTE